MIVKAQYLLQHLIMDCIACVISMVCYCWASLCCLDDAFLHMAMQQYHVTNAWLRWACDLDLHTSAKAEPQQLDNAFSTLSNSISFWLLPSTSCIIIDLFFTHPLPVGHSLKAAVKSYFELELKTNNSSRSPFSRYAWLRCFSCYAWFLWEHDWNCWSRNLQCLH